MIALGNIGLSLQICHPFLGGPAADGAAGAHKSTEKTKTTHRNRPGIWSQHGANDEARTRYLHLGKVALYQMSYVRIAHF